MLFEGQQITMKTMVEDVDWSLFSRDEHQVHGGDEDKEIAWHWHELVSEAESRGLIGGAKVITIKQPWAYAIFHLGKDVENRGWIPGYKGRLYIHTGAAWDEDGETWIKDQGMTIDYSKIVFGAVIGHADMTITTSRSRWAIAGQYHWNLSDQTLLDRPLPVKGRLGSWECNLNQLRKQAETASYWGELDRQFVDDIRADKKADTYKGWDIYLAIPNGGIVGVSFVKGDRVYTLCSELSTEQDVFHDPEWHINQAKLKIDRLILDAKAEKLARDRARPQIQATQLSLFGGLA